MKMIGEDCGVSETTIRHYIIKFRIPRRRSGPARKVHRAEVSTRVPAWLRDEVKNYAKLRGMYISDVVKAALLQYLALGGEDVETKQSVQIERKWSYQSPARR